MSKLDKATVLYMDGKDIGDFEGAHCGVCRYYRGDPDRIGNCDIVTGEIDGPKGVCGLFVRKRVSPEVAGYATSGPTHCGNCKFYGGDVMSGPCKIVEGEVEAHGCCNAWQRAEPKERRI